MKAIITNFLSSPIFMPTVLLLASLFALAGAYTAEYGFDLQPCSLCSYERIPYFIVAVLAVVAIFFATKKARIAKILCVICAVLMLFEFGLSGYHIGVEKGVFEESCTVNFTAEDIESLKEELFATPVISCKDVQFELFGISMAGWNALYALGLAGFVFMGISYKPKKS